MLSESGVYYRSVLSNSMRREVLWNVVEPSDPYDIRKYAKRDVDQRLADCQEIRKSKWAITWNWSACFRLQK